MIEFFKVKKNYLMALAVFFVFISLSGTTYSLFINTDETNTFTYTTGQLDISFSNNEQLTLSNAFPTIDSEGEKTNPYKLIIKNTGNISYLFDLQILAENGDNVIDNKYIKVKIDDELPHTLYETENYIKKDILLYPDEEIEIDIRMWLDSSTPNKELGKTFTAKVYANGESVYKTLDTSGANHPTISDDYLPVYYDNGLIKLADQSNTNENYQWYDYDEAKWANVVKIKDDAKKIYDITGTKDIIVNDDLIIDNKNIILKNKAFDTTNTINSNIQSIVFRTKVNNLNNDITFIYNDKIKISYKSISNQYSLKVNGVEYNSNALPISEDTWQIIAFTYDGTTAKLYLNGEVIISKNITTNLITNNSYKLGLNTSDTNYSEIIIGNLYLYNKALTGEEIKNSYSTSIKVITESLVSGYENFYPMTLKEYYQNKGLGTVIKSSDISLSLVWIPRYKYKLWNVTGESNIDSYDAKNSGIEISFENNLTTDDLIYCQNFDCFTDDLLISKVTQNDNDKYYTPTAFTKKNVYGIWVSKYELTAYDESVANKIALNNVSLENILANLNSNYQIITNTEWGAVVYLSYSKYGTCQNGTCIKVEPNKTNITGNSLKDSTTLNEYGIFDMAGSSSELVLASLSENNFLSKYNNLSYDIYSANKFILGDATKELLIDNSLWFNSTYNFINETNNLLLRGGNYKQDGSTIFTVNSTTNSPNEYISTRITLK